MADNTLSNHDFYFLESALNEDDEHVELTFHINEYKTFKDVPAVHISDREQLFQKTLVHFLAETPCVIACNTKADAKYFRQRLWDETTDVKLRARLRIYTGDTKSSTNIAQEVKYWYLSVVIHSPKISTGIDYHPETPIDVFYVGRGENTVCPATAVQMVTRTRSIKTLYICLDRMRNTPKYQNEAEMNANLDMLQNSYQQITQRYRTLPEHFALAELNERTWCKRQLKDVYSENKFSKGYRAWLWNEEIMKASWVFNFNTYLRKRGFIVIEEEPGAQILLQDPEVRTNVMKKCDQDLMAELNLWKGGKDTQDAELFDGRLACVREFHKNTKNDDQSMQLSRSKQHLNAVIASFKGSDDFFARMRINNIFLSAAMTIRNQNMLFGIYTLKKLLKIKEVDHIVEYDFPNAHTVCTSVLLLRELIEVFNKGLPEDVHLKTYDITLSQTQYNEDDEVEVPDHVWQLYVYKCRSVKKQPTTRRALMGAICMLSHRTFGKFFTTKTVTSRSEPCKKGGTKQVRCYDYVGDDMFLRVHVQLADCSKRELADIEPAIVSKYNLKERQERDVEKCPNAQKILQQKKNEKEKIAEKKKCQEKAEREQSTVSKKAFDNCLNRNFKCHKIEDVPVCVSAALALPSAIQYTTSQEELRRVQLKRQKEWHLDFNKKELENKRDQKRQRRDDES